MANEKRFMVTEYTDYGKATLIGIYNYDDAIEVMKNSPLVNDDREPDIWLVMTRVYHWLSNV